jgi:protein-S-isoprenylcysteine O-methyltransferase Ste14
MDGARGRDALSAGWFAGRLVYGLVFVALIPAALAAWAHALAPLVALPAVQSLPAGAALSAGGLALMVAGTMELAARGGGLPMNAYPPPRLVHSGVFRWVRNPIYLGFALAVAGLAVAAGSAAGLWIVTPAAALGCAALWFGYERHALVARFGPAAFERPLLSFPPATAECATWADRAAVILWVLVPWLLAWLAVQRLGPARDAFRLALPFERGWPVLQASELVYVSAYLFVPLTPLIIRTRRDLRRFAVSGLLATALVTLIWLTVPAVAANRPFVPEGVLGRLLAAEQRHSTGVAAFPAFHVLWALLAARGWLANARATGRRAWAWVGTIWALLIAASSLTTGMHTVVEVAAAVLLFVPLSQYRRSWALLRDATERLANSWHEWRAGPVRIINHGIYAGLAAFAGALLVGMLTGPGGVAVVAWIGLLQMLGAGLTAQALEGSSKLLRPFGWYGGVAGAVIGCLTAPLFGVPALPLLAAVAVAAPWIQLIGRLRCLVQGCCHGAPASAETGIRYRHRRSRVKQIADLAGVPLHPTPLYSILGNVVIGVVLLRLRVIGASNGMELGIYLVLGGLARFVEESYRGEPQTRVIGGLHIYQWLAIASVAAGMLCTTIPSTSPASPFTAPTPALWSVAAGLGLLAAFAMGMDFPQSNRRFSRLAAAD